MKPENYPTFPSGIWNQFYHLTKIPRPSHGESAVRNHLISLARQHGHAWKYDDIGNVVIYVPGSPQLKHRPAVILQAHMDMVTVKDSDSNHDFSKDPLNLKVIDTWLTAGGTSLGADNGIGCAAALALLSDPEAVHPPLELLFTVAEETGLHGASQLDASLLSGTRMLNLDGETWGEILIGCAGGKSWEFLGQLQREPNPTGFCTFELILDGLTGGHSGLQIHQQAGNPIKLMSQWLIAARALGVRLINFAGGTALNVIPRSATLTFSCPGDNVEKITSLNNSMTKKWRTYLPSSDAGLSLKVQPHPPSDILTQDSQQRLEQLLTIFPHGAQTYNLQQPADLVDLSCNFASIRTHATRLHLEASVRFFDTNEAVTIENCLVSIAQLFDFSVKKGLDYPAWKPEFNSALLTLTKDIYKQTTGASPQVKAIHAGLECGILKGKLGDIDIVSFGPTIRQAHSPSERVDISSVASFWHLLTEVLKNL